MRPSLDHGTPSQCLLRRGIEAGDRRSGVETLDLGSVRCCEEWTSVAQVLALEVEVRFMKWNLRRVATMEATKAGAELDPTPNAIRVKKGREEMAE